MLLKLVPYLLIERDQFRYLQYLSLHKKQAKHNGGKDAISCHLGYH